MTTLVSEDCCACIFCTRIHPAYPLDTAKLIIQSFLKHSERESTMPTLVEAGQRSMNLRLSLASLAQTINLRPQVGWVRGTFADTSHLLKDKLEVVQAQLEAISVERDSLRKDCKI